MSTHRLDPHDLAIVRLLQEDAGQPQREIARRVNLSPPAVQRRIARMQKEGIIRRTVAIVDQAAVGFPITVLVNVTLTDDRSATVSAVKAFFRDAPEVQQCYCVTGTAGFVLILLVPSMEDYEERTARLLADNELVRSYHTVVVLDRVKTGTGVPL
ncbi:Lrp/AsnC family transcriptional regulator [Gluconacetobacter entanii]|uniref:AsnC family transcriptional regulator n=1 Tax=Gluconacetobacter entanii TaxID=108528 RepID=A0A318PQB7_9PROT|nr:Lrp/AsnC family transcriptional regulator [Gluconacetobacter entanii]MBE7618205.1 winged helix-turn-helix transcriptional regulator [Komagataeibacter sp. FXV2]MCE2578890.1 Lrp/AsnC family transcriptional regulator [Komagataeibacter sp. FNDCR1]MCW4590408.1 Lrp/AsnC family transcriptional regulator [Gluconacetobacter entanii]MCW4594360.1 Lrp/AsnC family transcriptional regulator [Gluconacetobacter entanii]NPC88185.1 Lrp/AsnC family transcriptional regulator [Gluconacetobacter entanii]